MTDRIYGPGSTLGVLGGGQLGRMFVHAAQRMGYRTHVFSPEADSPAGQVAHATTVADYEDHDAVARFANDCDAISFELEQLPLMTAEIAARHAPVRPGPAVLEIAQDRIKEKNFLRDAGLPVGDFAPIKKAEDLAPAIEKLGCPAVLKTAGGGYDGKGQARIDRPDQLAAAWAGLGEPPCILEAWVDYIGEVSVIAVRDRAGGFEAIGPIRNVHVNHILDLSVYPPTVPERVERDAIAIARQMVESLEVVGVLCVEMFLTPDEALLINEIAPRPHNSGHLTIEACAVSQFEQQVRVTAGLPAGRSTLRRAGAMANLLGDLWAEGEPDFAAALAVPEVSLHLYGKAEARPGRKMGHLTALGDTSDLAAGRALGARAALIHDGLPAALGTRSLAWTQP